MFYPWVGIESCVSPIRFVRLTNSPSLGAYFASRPLPLKATRDSWNVFALPAAISLALLTFETLYLFFTLPETRHLKSTVPPPTATSVIKPDSPETRLRRLRRISTAHGLFLLFFSGVRAIPLGSKMCLALRYSTPLTSHRPSSL